MCKIPLISASFATQLPNIHTLKDEATLPLGKYFRNDVQKPVFPLLPCHYAATPKL